MARLGGLLDAYAESLAQETGLDYGRVRKVIGLSVRDRALTPVREDSQAEVDPAEVFIWPDLREAIPFLGPERSLRLFEEAGVERLGRRFLVVDRLSRAAPPLYRFSELKQHLAALGAHLSRNRGDLLQTGYPGELFAESLWLGSRLSPLYPIKQPFCAEIVATEDHTIKVYHTWIREPWTTTLDERGKLRIVEQGREVPSPGRVVSRDYSEAPILCGLTPEVVACINRQRANVLSFKLETLRLLERAANAGPGEDMVGQYIGLLRHSFTPEVAKALLVADSVLFSETEVSRESGTLHDGAGGIAATTELVLLLRRCARSSAFEELRNVLEKLDLISAEPYADPRPVIESYYEVVDKPWHDDVDRAIASFWKTCKEEDDRILEDLTRIGDAMPENVTTRHTVWGGDAAAFEELVNGYAGYQKTQIEQTGRFGTMDLLARSAGKSSAGRPAEVTLRPPAGTRLRDLSLNLTQDELEARAGSWSAHCFWAELFPEDAPGPQTQTHRLALEHFARNGGLLRAGDEGLPGSWIDRIVPTYMGRLRKWLTKTLGLGENPILWDRRARAYVLQIAITESGVSRFPTPNGATWGAVTIEEVADDLIEVSVEGARSSGVQQWEPSDDGVDLPVTDVAVSRETATRRYTLERLGLTETHGKKALGVALVRLLRARGRVVADRDDMTMPELSRHLQEFLNIDQSAFKASRNSAGGFTWIASFRASSQRRKGSIAPADN